MSVQLFGCKETSISARDLKDGQIAQVIEGSYTGTIVQAYGGHLVAIGKDCGKGWDNRAYLTMKVIPLPNGTKLEIIDN